MSRHAAREVTESAMESEEISALAREVAFRWHQLSHVDLSRLSADPAFQALAPALKELAWASLGRDIADQGGSTGWPPPPPMRASHASELVAALDLADHVSPVPVQARAALCLFRQALADSLHVSIPELRKQLASYVHARE